jgi:hypothetical protein
MENKPVKISLEDLKRFKEKADALYGDKYLALHKQQVSISLKEGLGRIVTEFPDEMLIESFLMKLRFFILERDNKFNFEKICQFFIENNFEQEKVSKWLDAYKRLLTEEVVGLNVNKKDLTIKTIFHTIINEGHFHQEMDQKGMTLIKSSPFIESFAKVKFFDVLSKMHLIICNFNKQVIEKYLSEYEK